MQNFVQEIAADFSKNGVLILRMLLASACGFIVGIERSRRQKDAGIRTHIIVALGSALLMLVSKYGFFDVVVYDGINLDASRIASNVITGISFLGAGVIFVKDISIKGLTTAAGIWCTSAIGISIGAGMYTLGISATVMLLLFQLVLHNFFDKIENTASTIKIIMSDDPNAFNAFRSTLEAKKIIINSYSLTKIPEDFEVSFEMTITRPRNVSLEEVVELAKEDKNIVSVEV